MSLWIKVCGNTSVEDALLCAKAGADAVGFVFAPSPRQVTTQQVATIVPRLPGTLEKIGVFVDATLEEIVATVRECGLTGVQLHFEARPELTKILREELGDGLRVLRVLHYGDDADQQAAHLAGDKNIDALLVDTRAAGAKGGTGLRFDWKLAATNLFLNPKVLHPLVVAGGLTAENVGEAIALLHPWGLDVVSGVETSPGRKGEEKVTAFVARARAASTGATSARIAP